MLFAQVMNPTYNKTCNQTFNVNAGIVEGCRNSAIGSYAAESVVHHPITTYNVTRNTSNICMIRITLSNKSVP